MLSEAKSTIFESDLDEIGELNVKAKKIIKSFDVHLNKMVDTEKRIKAYEQTNGFSDIKCTCVNATKSDFYGYLRNTEAELLSDYQDIFADYNSLYKLIELAISNFDDAKNHTSNPVEMDDGIISFRASVLNSTVLHELEDLKLNLEGMVEGLSLKQAELLSGIGQVFTKMRSQF